MNRGKKIKNIRKRKEISQKELANRAELSQAYISAVENDIKNISFNSLNKVCESLDISITEFFNEDSQAIIDDNLKKLINEIQKLTPNLQLKLKEFITEINQDHINNNNKKIKKYNTEKEVSVLIDSLRKRLNNLIELGKEHDDNNIVEKSKKLDQILKRYQQNN